MVEWFTIHTSFFKGGIMKMWFAVLVAVILFGTLLYGQAASPAAPAPASAVGRYQISTIAPIIIPQQVHESAEVWMVDTQTGDIWCHSNGGWRYEGNPTKQPGLKN
jgi:hypothetical protein